MKQHRFVTVDVFTGRRFGGNPLAVFPDARGISDSDMQALAREFNLSETSFVLPPDNPTNTARVRIFNTSHEMPFAGHPNVGTGFVLAQAAGNAGDVLRFEELAGLVEVRIARGPEGAIQGATVTAPQPLSLHGAIGPELIAACIGLDQADLVTDTHPALLASTGNPLVFAEVLPQALGRATPSLEGFRRATAATPALGGRLGLYLYAQDGQRLRARLFSPLDGTWEDPATGSAATTIAALLLSLGANDRQAWEISQGTEIGRPSLLRASAWRDRNGIRADVGGDCVMMLRGVTVA
ncbi:PhzF family phenazine biosynthesis protein [Lichenicoccus sp.]|uniref:PhzF family phenazine biosynthesis protein n=1 Tax=Lichenicoccus sp. TaxID=2781899 RepID=UPI003D0A8A4A